MIYKLNDNRLDISKLEMVTNIKEDIDFAHGLKPNGLYYFEFQINGVKYMSDKFDKQNIEQTREILINVWKSYKEEL